MKYALALIACLALSTTVHASQPPPIPLGLKCSVATVVHSNEFSAADTKSDNLAYVNDCISAVQNYTRAHCPQHEMTIWQQVEAVSFSGPGLPDAKALLAACR